MIQDDTDAASRAARSMLSGHRHGRRIPGARCTDVLGLMARCPTVATGKDSAPSSTPTEPGTPMRMPLLALVLLLTAFRQLAADDAITIRAIQVISQATVPDGVPDEAKRIMFNDGFTIGYLIEGSDIIGIKEHSLKIEHMLLPDGTDISKTRNGDDNFKEGSFPAFSDDGQFGYFQVASKHRLFGKVESLAIKGSIVVRTGSALTTVTSKEHDLKASANDTLDEFAVVITPPGKSANHGQQDDDEKNSCSVVVTGSVEKISEIRLVVADTEIKPESWTSSEVGPRTYSFPLDAAVAKFTLKIKYWKNLKELPIDFGK
jgi:hypothetical protein